jgi:glycerol-3-phosphate O-acyltransferase
VNATQPANPASLGTENLAESPEFRAALAKLAYGSGRDEASVVAQALGYLHELRSGHSDLVYSWLVRAGRALLGSGYARIDYDPAQVARMRELLRKSPAVVLSSHKSYLDGGALTVGFHDHGLPPLTVFGGINMSFWPLGSLWRRANMVFIRRGGDDAVYRCTLRHYLAFLVSQRRPLQWFLEGTRSRTGKLAPPRLGLLVYIADAYRDGRIADVQLVPVAVSYDQLQEVTEYAGEARGAAKSAESLGWLVRFVRSQRGRFGNVYVRFGAPVSVRSSLGSPEEARAASPEGYRLALQKLAFEVSCRINDAIPVSGSSLVTLALLGARGHALTLQQIRAAVPGYLGFARKRGLPMAPTSALDSDAAVAGVLDGLVAQGVAGSHAAGERAVFGIAPEQHLAAAYYRNAIVHHFLSNSIAELALLGAAEQAPADRTAGFESEALAIRDLLKFDFFFGDREQFLAGVESEASALALDWRELLAAGPTGVAALLETAPMLCSDMMLRSFFEAYAVVALVIASGDQSGSFQESALLDRCMGLGQQYLLQGRLRSPEAISRHLFRAGIELARNRGLCSPSEGVDERRREFAARLQTVLRRLSVVHRVAVQRVERALGAAAGSTSR